MFYKKSSKSNRIRCEICSNYCKINDGKFGICKQYKNENGELKDCNFAVVSALNVDPIEKKPLYHFLPNTYTYSVGGFGCNMDCLFCQNISSHSVMTVLIIKLKYFQKLSWKMLLIQIVNQFHGPTMNLQYIYLSI